MKLHTIIFVDSRGYTESRTVIGLGRVSSLSVGQTVHDGSANSCVISSLECDTRSGVLLIRKRARDGGDPQSGRVWANGTGETQRRDADFCMVHIGTATCYGDDADNEKKTQVVANHGPNASTQQALGNTPNLDPPPAKSIPAQGRGSK
jgi:hypothetical protein